MANSLFLKLIAILFTGAVIFTACASPSNTSLSAPVTGNQEKIAVVATTTLVGDVVKNVGGEHVDLVVLIPPGMDEHGFEPTPQDITRVARADLVFMNGAGLEGFIEKLMRNAGDQARLVSVSEGIELQDGPDHDEDEASSGEEPHDGDPHIWTDPNNVIIWVDNIQKTLSEADPENAADYQKNADQYRQQLKELDAWVREQVAALPQDRRKLVTDHTIFTYFANRYGFEQVGAVVPGYSTLSSPSAQELAALENAIRDLGVPAIFVGNTVNPATSERVAKDTQTKLVPILTGSLTDANGPAPTYIEYIRYNVQSIVEALQ